jgi:DNA-binding MarR family transcriptional regulator
MDNEKIREFRRLLRQFEQQTQLQTDTCCGITMPSCQALLEIEYLGQSSLKQLAKNLGLDPSTLSRTVDGLVNLDLVQRTPNQEDRRYLVLSLTAKGQQTCSEVNASSDHFYTRVFQQIPQTQRGEVLEAFEAFVKAMRSTIDNELQSSSK